MPSKCWKTSVSAIVSTIFPRSFPAVNSSAALSPTMRPTARMQPVTMPSMLQGIDRAVAKNPKILLCDEPTGALDYNTGKQVLQILQDMSRKKGATVVIVTHNSAIAPIADRVIRMHDGKVTAVDVNEHPMGIAELEW